MNALSRSEVMGMKKIINLGYVFEFHRILGTSYQEMDIVTRKYHLSDLGSTVRVKNVIMSQYREK